MKVLLKYKILVGVLALCMVVCAIYQVTGPEARRAHAPNTFTLKTAIGPPHLYDELVTTLEYAQKGEKIYIILDHNPGGRIASALKVLTAIQTTKATVYTTFTGFAGSAAFAILFAGDIITIPKQFVGIAHLSSNRKGSDYYLIPILSHLRYYMTEQQWESFINDGDVPVYGEQVCAISPKKISETKSTCTLRGSLR